MNIFSVVRKHRTETTDGALPAAEAKKLILGGRAPANLCVTGHLNLSGDKNLCVLPAGLTAESLDLSGCVALRELPSDLRVKRLYLNGCEALEKLPAGLSCYELGLRETPVRGLPADLKVEYRLDLQGCTRLVELPAGLKVGSLNLRGCTSLKALPEGLDVYFLDISDCVELEQWPDKITVRLGRLSASGCARLRSLPPQLSDVAQLDVSGCTQLSELPEDLRVSSWIDLARTQIEALPVALKGVQLRWGGVPVDERIAFHPETITPQEILSEVNVELRRVLLERVGYERFIAEARAEVIDTDRDRGGERRLLRVPLPRDEDLVCVSVICPSTGDQYMLRVPPTMRSCRQAVAWVAGFENPDDYRPIIET